MGNVVHRWNGKHTCPLLWLFANMCDNMWWFVVNREKERMERVIERERKREVRTNNNPTCCYRHKMWIRTRSLHRHEYIVIEHSKYHYWSNKGLLFQRIALYAMMCTYAFEINFTNSCNIQMNKSQRKRERESEFNVRLDHF